MLNVCFTKLNTVLLCHLANAFIQHKSQFEVEGQQITRFELWFLAPTFNTAIHQHLIHSQIVIIILIINNDNSLN